jgi:hypothetical protein
LASNIAIATPATMPSPITNLVATPGNNQVALSWTAPNSGGSAITDYIIQYKLSSSVSYTTFPDGTSTSTGGTVIGLTNGLSYDFKVSAVNAVGTGLASNIATVVPNVVCSVPSSGNWIITSSCKITGNVHPLGNVDVQSAAVVTIENGGTLNIDFATKYLKIHAGSGVWIKSGGKIN